MHDVLAQAGEPLRPLRSGPARMCALARGPGVRALLPRSPVPAGDLRGLRRRAPAGVAPWAGGTALRRLRRRRPAGDLPGLRCRGAQLPRRLLRTLRARYPRRRAHRRRRRPPPQRLRGHRRSAPALQCPQLATPFRGSTPAGRGLLGQAPPQPRGARRLPAAPWRRLPTPPARRQRGPAVARRRPGTPRGMGRAAFGRRRGQGPAPAAALLRNVARPAPCPPEGRAGRGTPQRHRSRQDVPERSDRLHGLLGEPPA